MGHSAPTLQTELVYLHPARESAPEPQGHGGSVAGGAPALAGG